MRTSSRVRTSAFTICISLKFYLEGVMVARKDYNAPKHEDLSVPNLEVIKALQSLTSRGYVKTQFSWQYYYYTLTPEGLEYLRELYVLLLFCMK